MYGIRYKGKKLTAKYSEDLSFHLLKALLNSARWICTGDGSRRDMQPCFCNWNIEHDEILVCHLHFGPIFVRIMS